MPGIFVGRLFDSGYFHLPFMLANIVLILATFLVAECTEFWQIVLCQGVFTGAACGTMFSPVLPVASQWFDKRRQLVFGVMSVGSSIGGTVLPVLVRALLPAVGYVLFFSISNSADLLSDSNGR
jgi:MCP family monocarboxylic acid transporter-like MFS transporter 10